MAKMTNFVCKMLHHLQNIKNIVMIPVLVF